MNKSTQVSFNIIVQAIFILVSCSTLFICQAQCACQYKIVESMPDQMKFTNADNLSFKPVPTHLSLINLINNAKSSLKVASYYWTLSAESEFAADPSAEPGRKIMEAIEAAAARGVKIEILLDQSNPKKSMSNESDIKRLQAIGKVEFLNVSQLLGSGVMHSKFLIADLESFYLGSSNFDWRSYTQIKEMGIMVTKCQVLAKGLDKIFKTYTFLSGKSKLPAIYPTDIMTDINISNPYKMEDLNVFFGASPPAFDSLNGNWDGRTSDITGLLSIINKAEKQIDISVMNYSPTKRFVPEKEFWPLIENDLKKAVFERHVRVRLLFSDWGEHTRDEELMWYKSLNAIQSEDLRGGGIQVKLFKVPSFNEFQKSVPYARVKHDKYMVTEKGLYLGTSNWTADYFTNTCGVGMVIEPTESTIIENSIVKEMQELFERDFTSEFAHDL